MCDAIRHRGPDDEGFFVGGRAALGMRRLSIIDVQGGAQPVSNEDGTVHVVFNGEIYNFRELRRRLARQGHRLATASDTETLVHLYEEEGDRLVHALRGMFAFAIWDGRRRRLLVARDRLGIKPLYYWHTAGGVVFASELGSLLALGEFPARIHRGAIAQYLAFGSIPDPHAVYEGVAKLPPGHLLSWDETRGLDIHRYWSPMREEHRSIDERDAVGEVRRLLDDAVSCHLESEVPLGAFLSGGVDSSAVVASMSAQLQRPVRTFAIGFAETDYNEAPHAATVARALNTEHTELVVRPDADALVTDVIRAFDEPFGDSSALPTFLVSRLARQSVTVVLSGDGGDELFAGYTRYAEVVRRRELRPAMLRRLLHASARRLPHSAPGRNRLLDLARTRWGRYASTVAIPLDVAEGGVALPELAASVGTMDALLDPWTHETRERDFVSRMLLADVQSYLPSDILTKVDRMSMAVSLEARVPLLDHHLVEFALALPSRLTMRDGSGKWLFRQAIAGLVPPAVVQRRKQGFAMPLASWFRRELGHRVNALRKPSALIYEYADPAAVLRIAAEHRRSRRDHSHLLWRLVALEIWLASRRTGAAQRRSTGMPIHVSLPTAS